MLLARGEQMDLGLQEKRAQLGLQVGYSGLAAYRMLCSTPYVSIKAGR
jgi:hypothetical protein